VLSKYELNSIDVNQATELPLLSRGEDLGSQRRKVVETVFTEWSVCIELNLDHPRTRKPYAMAETRMSMSEQELLFTLLHITSSNIHGFHPRPASRD
jgi:hypothetical protein